MNKISYKLVKEKKKKEIKKLDYDKLDGYTVNPKGHKEDSIEVSKIVFINSKLSQIIIRKKIDKKINYLLKQLKQIEEDESSDDDGGITKNIMLAEKLRMQIINNYVKYLGNTYSSLTIEKLELIIERLKYRIYANTYYKKLEDDKEKKEHRKSR